MVRIRVMVRVRKSHSKTSPWQVQLTLVKFSLWLSSNEFETAEPFKIPLAIAKSVSVSNQNRYDFPITPLMGIESRILAFDSYQNQ